MALDGHVYVMGGLTPDGGVTSKVEAYDPVSDSWEEKAALPLALHHVGATVLEGKIYVIGGFTSGFKPVDTVFQYDPAIDTWRARAPLPTPRGALPASRGRRLR